jgi:hypothetical protein
MRSIEFAPQLRLTDRKIANGKWLVVLRPLLQFAGLTHREN